MDLYRFGGSFCSLSRITFGFTNGTIQLMDLRFQITKVVAI